MPGHEPRPLRHALPLMALMICVPATADTLVHGFRNPAFSGVGYSSHVLTIENQERNRREELKDERVSEALAAERNAENTVEARFLRNLESRIYSQLSRQLVDNLFGESPSTSGTFQLLDSTVSFEDNGQEIRLVIENPDGVTELVLPSEQFLF
jgi:Curli production assembly/transport component CsgF.